MPRTKRAPRERLVAPVRLTPGWRDLLDIPESVPAEGHDNPFEILHAELVINSGTPGPHMLEMWEHFGCLSRDVRGHPLFKKIGPPRGWKPPLQNKAKLLNGKVAKARS